jgi:alpha-L-arabinofuranosidase
VLHATFTTDAAFPVGPIDPRLFGSFLEHMGRAVYTGVYEPAHPNADVEGFRTDVLDLVRELGPTIVRYPGGNFVSGYRWEDGIGPAAERPRRLDLAWRSVEPNTFGVDEFMRWVRRADVEPMMAVNLGTRGIEAARDLVEYCNHPGGTRLSDLRARYGHAEPYDIRVWCLGNEMDGPWQTGAKTAEEYGRLAHETAKAMKAVDERIELVACGSSGRSMPTFGAWEATVLEHTYDDVEYISLHTYYENFGDLGVFLARAVDMDLFIREVIATADHVGARLGSRKRIDLSFDEWNVWRQSEWKDEPPQGWPTAPRLIEDTYTLADAVLVGSMLITLLRHADRVKIGCQAQLVNVIAPIRSEPGGAAWRQTIFHPFAQVAHRARGTVLRTEPVGDTYDHEELDRVSYLDAVVTFDEETDAYAVFAVNRSPREELALEAVLHGTPRHRVAEHLTVTGDDPLATNTAAAPDRVAPVAVDGATLSDGRLSAVLPPMSWNVLSLVPA